MRLLLIEGLPGSGKTTTARELCGQLQRRGTGACWYREESTDHPIHPKPLTDRCDAPEYSAECLRRWRWFVERARENEVLHIMEGSAFQSTVRPMMEYEHAGIEEYFSEFAGIVSPLAPALIYLRANDPVENSRYISARRGKKWTATVSKGETATPYSIRNDLVGLQGMHLFWEHYACLCDSLIPLWTLPKLTIWFEPGDWRYHLPQVCHFLESLGVLLAPRKS